MVIHHLSFEATLHLGSNHESGDTATTTVRSPPVAAIVCAEVALIPRDEQEAISAGLKLRHGENLRDLLREPGIGLTSASIVGVMLQIRCDVNVVCSGVIGNFVCHMSERYAVELLAGSTYICKVNQRVMPADVIT